MAESTEKTETPFWQVLAWIGLMFAFPVAIYAILYYGVTLLILAFVIAFAALITGVFLIIRSYAASDNESEAVTAEIKSLANDASFDVSEQIIVWDRLKLTKGMGTQLEGHEDSIREIYDRLVRVRMELDAAETPKHRLEAVLHADSILATASSLR